MNGKINYLTEFPIIFYEVLFGSLFYNSKEIPQVEQFFESVTVLDFNYECASAVSVIHSSSMRAGCDIGVMDSLIYDLSWQIRSVDCIVTAAAIDTTTSTVLTHERYAGVCVKGRIALHKHCTLARGGGDGLHREDVFESTRNPGFGQMT